MLTAWSPRRSWKRATSVISIVTGSVIRPEASSAIRLACSSSISSSRVSSAGAADRSRWYQESTAWRHISEARLPMRSTIPRVLGEDVVGPGGDLPHEVMGTLELRHDPQHGEQEAQVRSDRRLQQDLPVDQFLDLRVEGVDNLLAIGQDGEYLVVAA